MSTLSVLALTRIPGIGAVLARTLLSHFGAAEAIFTASYKQLLQIEGIGPQLARNIRQFKEFDACAAELAFANTHDIQTLILGDENYPKRLSYCYDAPILLFYKGNAHLNASKIVSIVGTRNATSYGKLMCEELVAGLADQGALVVSGLAYGIDAVAHKACLKIGLPTLGVLAHGLDRMYPYAHRKLAVEMLEKGGLLTEFPSQSTPDRENFPKRNRIIAGLADATIVVEANVKGGALITADLANSYDREVCAFPGRASDEYSLGCNELIKTNRAHLVTQAADVLALLSWDIGKPLEKRPLAADWATRTPDEHLVLRNLTHREGVHLDRLAFATGFSSSKLSLVLLGLQLAGLVHIKPGNCCVLA
ncbi:MAG: DNA-processing protein DprA [Sphingobacteriaceae bacterium]